MVRWFCFATHTRFEGFFRNLVWIVCTELYRNWKLSSINVFKQKELAVHYGKLREVTEVCMAAKTRNTCVAVLTGPSGSSKSTCLLMVCRTLGFSPPLIWAESDCEDGAVTLNELQQFEEFLFKSTHYNCSGDVSKVDFSFSISKQQSRAPQLVLIEVCLHTLCGSIFQAKPTLSCVYSLVIDAVFLMSF